MSESIVFELKLQIQHLQEKLTFLAGGTSGAELVEVLMEKDDELEKKNRQLKEAETKMYQLGDASKRVDAKRRELLRHSEHQAVRIQALEREVDRQLAAAEDFRRKVSDSQGELSSAREELSKLKADMETAEANACDDLSAARSEVSDLQGMVERQREKIVDLEKTKTSLEETVAAKEEEVKNMEQRKKDTAKKAMDIKKQYENQLNSSNEALSACQGENSTLKAELGKLRRRIDERAKQALDDERKFTAMARECGALKAELEAARQEIASSSGELAAVRTSKHEADERVMVMDKENSKLRAKKDALKQEIDRRVESARQDKAAMGDRMEESRRTHEEREATLHEQMRAMERDSSTMTEVLMSKVAGLEKQLQTVEAEGTRLREEACSLREEASGRARKAEAANKAELRRRARAEEALAEAEGDARGLRSELATFRHQAVELKTLQAENKELKDHVERQAAFFKRKMEKDRRARSATRGSARSSMAMLPLPRPMSEVGIGESGTSSTGTRTRAPTAGHGDEDDGGGGGGSEPETTTGRSSRRSSATSCSNRRSSTGENNGGQTRPPPRRSVSVGRSSDTCRGASNDKMYEKHAAGEGDENASNAKTTNGNKNKATSNKSDNASEISPSGHSSRASSPTLSSTFTIPELKMTTTTTTTTTPTSEASSEKENGQTAPRRQSPAAAGQDSCSGSKAISGDADRTTSKGADCVSGVRGREKSSTSGYRGRVGGLGSINRLSARSRESSLEKGDARGSGEKPSLGSRSIHHVGRSSVQGTNENPRHPSRGRRTAASRTTNSRPSVERLQSRAALGWR